MFNCWSVSENEKIKNLLKVSCIVRYTMFYNEVECKVCVCVCVCVCVERERKKERRERQIVIRRGSGREIVIWKEYVIWRFCALSNKKV